MAFEVPWCTGCNRGRRWAGLRPICAFRLIVSCRPMESMLRGLSTVLRHMMRLLTSGPGRLSESGERLIEVNLLDQTSDLYGQEITVQFVARVRGDHTFASADELSKQIARDVEQARISLRRIPQGVQ